MSLHVRPMNAGDALAVSSLLPHLGYEASPAELRARLTSLREWPDQEVFVAEFEDVIVGLSQVQGVRLLVSNGYAEVQALVVAPEHQGKGFGAAMLQHTMRWCIQQGYARVRLRSGVHREGAHTFYLAQGFSQSKASYAFELNVAQPGV